MNLNNKGFTLIELIATIALLAVIAIISFVSINGVVNQSKVNDCEALVMNIKSAAKEYVSDNRYASINKNITAQDLINGKYLSSPIINPFTKEDIDASTIKINITLKDDYSADVISVYKNEVSDDNKYICDDKDKLKDKLGKEEITDSDIYDCNITWWNFG